jgi:hypothetical protein
MRPILLLVLLLAVFGSKVFSISSPVESVADEASETSGG